MEVELELEQSPQLELKLADDQGEVVFKLVSDQEITKISTALSEENVENSSLSLSGLKRARLVVELQSEGVFVDLVGVGSLVLAYPASSWSGNESVVWGRVAAVSKVFLGGRGVRFTFLSAHVLVF